MKDFAEERKLTKEEIKKWLIENCQHPHKYKCIDLSGLDFTEDDVQLVDLSGMKVPHIVQSHHEAKTISQEKHKVEFALAQDFQTVGSYLFQARQTVGKDLMQMSNHVSGTIIEGCHICEEVFNAANPVTTGEHADKLGDLWHMRAEL